MKTVCLCCGGPLRKKRNKEQYICANKDCALRVGVDTGPKSLTRLTSGILPPVNRLSEQKTSVERSVENPSVAHARKRVREIFEHDNEAVQSLKLTLVLCAQNLELDELSNRLIDKFDLSELFGR